MISGTVSRTGPGGIKRILNSNEHALSTDHKKKMLKNIDIFSLKLPCCIYPAHKCKNTNIILLINVKMLTIVAI